MHLTGFRNGLAYAYEGQSRESLTIVYLDKSGNRVWSGPVPRESRDGLTSQRMAFLNFFC